MRCIQTGILPSAGVLCILLLADTAFARPQPSAQAPIPVDGATVRTADQLVDLALARNAALLAAGQRSMEAQGLLLQSGLRPNPSLEISAGGGGLTNSPGESEITVGYSHAFEMGRKRERRMAVARLGVDLASLSVVDRERQLRADVKSRYGEALAALRNLESTERLLELNQQSLRIATARAREGEGAPLEQALIQVEVNRLQADRLLFQNQVELALLELRTLTGMGPDEPLQLAGQPAAPALRITLAEAVDRALDGRPDLGIAKLEENLGAAETEIARAEFDRRSAEYRNSLASAESLKAEAAKEEEKLHRFGMTDGEIGQLSLRADSQYHRKESHTTIAAPFAGVITDYNAVPGEPVGPDDQLLTIADLSVVWVQADIYEKDIAAVQERAAVSVYVDAYPGRAFAGKVTYISDILDPRTRTAKVRCEVPNPDGLLKLEMFATIRIPAPAGRQAILVPIEAIQRIEEQPVAFVKTRTAELEIRALKLGERSNGWIDVLEGIRAAEQVVTEGSFILKSETRKAELGHHE